MDRVILHVDANCFFASVETAYNPKLASKPVAVAGDAKARHGIILTANYIAKKYGVKTGEPIFAAKQKCPELAVITSNPARYLQHSALMRKILSDYSSRVEPFGCDEAWLDITDIAANVDDGKIVAADISARIKRELHITVSIGVSFCKVFAKFASDYKKPDAITVISRENYRDIVWSCPCRSLLSIGAATAKQLSMRGIYTIGGIAKTPPELLRSWFGKNGILLHAFANGNDIAAVRKTAAVPMAKSVGNSTTACHDLCSSDDVKNIFFVLADSVARRLREDGLCGRTVTIWLRRQNLSELTHRCTLSEDTDVAFDIADAAMKLFEQVYDFGSDVPLRSVGITVSSICRRTKSAQLSIFSEDTKRERRRALECAMDGIRGSFGYYSICRASLLSDTELTRFDPKADHRLHPVGVSGRAVRVQ